MTREQPEDPGNWQWSAADRLMQNLFGSHDTARVAGQADVRAPDAHGRALQRLPVWFQMTALGVPMVYSGDEAGLWGANDPCGRNPTL
ncbi:MAG TPA: alpha-amylase family glycosyl hydrolase [Burkholderiaceae bacterium]|nr:alpha-amylase family glycosyl hydrolase [Burkholderiaceae bacterium]